VKEAFDANGDGRADLVGCPPGWEGHVITNHHMDVYDLRDHVNLVEASYVASFADLLARYRNGEPVAFYTWTPNFTILELVPGEDVMWINVPEIVPGEGQEGLEDAMATEDLEGAVSSPIRLGFVIGDVNIVANDTFLAANPAAAALFERVRMSLEDISEMTARITEGENSDDDIRTMAQEWIEDNHSEVDDWLQFIGAENKQGNINVKECQDIIRKLNREKNLTVLLVEQKLPFVRRTSDHFVIMDRGRTVAKGELEELNEDLVQEYLTV